MRLAIYGHARGHLDGAYRFAVDENRLSCVHLELMLKCDALDLRLDD
jgi:hypothetical protein